MVEIKDISGKVLFSVLPNEQSKSVEELMNSDYIQLSWMSDKGTPIPLSAYIECNGEKYTLHEPYTPIRQDECTYQYAPQFQSRIMNWSKQITPIYTYEEDGRTVKSRDMDWDFTGSPADAMYIIKQAIKNETGEDWTVQLSDSLPATITISSQSSSIFSILNSIASECKTEWWADKKTNTLYLSKCIFGESITLEVGNNVQVPSVATDSEGYYTRFYAFGSTRNIVQSPTQSGAVVNNRLTLDPVKYPNGYKDIREGLKQNEIFVKVLYFDEIYPSSKLTISDVRARLRYRLDNAGQKIQIGGTEEEPVYEQYAIWYFQIADFSFNADMIIEGKKLSVSFGSGQLASRDFELAYHEKTETVSDANDVTPFEVKAGDYEIIIDETSGQIIPGVAYIIPQNGDSVILYNIQMPAEYTASAQAELEKELDKAMAYYTEDNNSYQIQSDPTWFYTNKTDISMGQAVTFINGTKSLSTRVLMVEKRLDLPCYQTIKVGNKVIKGNTQQLKDEVASANQNIDVIQAFNELSASLSQAYANAQREMIEGFAAIKNLWTLETDENGEKYAYTKYNVLTQGGVTQYSAGNSKIPSIFDGLPLDNTTIRKNPETGLIEVIGGTGTSFDENAMWSALSGSSDNQINKSHLTNALAGYATESWVTGKGYATESWVASKNYATTEALNAVSNKLNDFLEGSDADTIINKWKELEAFLSGMAETDNLAEILETKADKKYVDSTFVTLATKQTITGEKTFSSVLNTAAIKASGAITAPSLAASDWVTIAGIKLRKLEDGALMLEGNLALTGALTMYASNGQSFGTIYDGLPIDNDTIYWEVVEGSKVLKAREGSGSSFDKSAMWTALAGSTTEQINKSHLTTALTGYATESWVSEKNYAVKATTLAGYGITDGINAVSVTGTGNAVTAASISGHTLTLTKGSTFSLSGHKHAWSDITSGKPTTLSGYGITDAYTKTDSDSRYINVSGDTMTGTLSFSPKDGSDMNPAIYSSVESSKTYLNFANGDDADDGFIFRVNYYNDTNTENRKRLIITWNSVISKASITAPSFIGSLNGNATSATKLQTARTLWGQSFNGTNNVSGDINNVGNINFTLNGRLVSNSSLELSYKNDDTTSLTFTGTVFRPFTSAHNNIDLGASTARWRDLYIGRNAYVDGITKTEDFYIGGIRLHKTADGVITLEGNLAVTGGVTMYAIDPVSASTIMDGVVVDGTTIKKENGKLVAVGGGEAGSVAWGNISGKPSVFATNIANITDLHSSWDSVLAAQKPAWLTAVSIATISDLHANWDALLKAAPSAYVTRWPTISEVTNKQSLIVKLNGGATEGTNQFTYNATGAKTINITPAGIGAAASSHSHNAISASLTGTNALNMVYAKMADNDYFRLRVGGTASNAGYVEFATADDGNEPIYFRQYTGTFTTVKRTLTLLDGGGNSSFPGTVTAPTFNGNLAWSHITSKPTTLAGYGITDAPTKTGSGASGTWGIGITGNAGSATKLQTTHTIWGKDFNGTQNVSGEISTCTRIRNSKDNSLYLGNSDNTGWVYTQDIASHNGVENWAIGITGTAWFQKVNIGYAHPAPGNYLLNVNGVISCSAYTGNYIRIECDDNGSNLQLKSAEINNFRSPLYLQHSSSFNLICCKGGGKVGIGTDSPNGKLHVEGNIYTSAIVSAYGYAGNHIRMECDNHGENIASRIDEINNYSAPLYLQHDTSNNLICCNGGGKVGIGTTSPTHKLTVEGNTKFLNIETHYGIGTDETGISSSAYYDISIPTIPAYKYRYVLGWQDNTIEGYTTGYGIGVYRSASKWGSMILEVLNYENKTRKAQLEIRGYDNVLWFSGDILAEGGGTFYGSDIRYKSIMQQVNLSLLDIAKAPSFVYRWNRPNMNQNRLNLGGSAQYAQKILPWAVNDNDNFLSMDYATVAYTFAVHTARHLMNYESKTDKKIRKLENRVKYLEKQLKKLGYEEVRTLDDQSV